MGRTRMAAWTLLGSLAACAYPKAPVTPAPVSTSGASEASAQTGAASVGFAAPAASSRTFLHQLAPSAERRVTVTYQDSDIRDVIAAFAVFSGRTIVVGKDVQGTVTAHVHDEPWDVALQSIVQLQQLAVSVDQYGIITVDRAAPGGAAPHSGS